MMEADNINRRTTMKETFLQSVAFATFGLALSSLYASLANQMHVCCKLKRAASYGKITNSLISQNVQLHL